MRIGVDFDNTIILYDAVFAAVGRDLGLLPAGFAGDKAAVRARVRALPDGERHWTRLQARVYGHHVEQARLAPGFAGFLARARAARVPVAVISHKTETAAAEPDGPDLRAAARRWLTSQDLTGAAGLPPAEIHFEATRADKLARIAAVGCTHFVDDLEELFREPAFPLGVERLLYRPGAAALPAGPFRGFRSWDAIAATLFGGAPP